MVAITKLPDGRVQLDRDGTISILTPDYTVSIFNSPTKGIQLQRAYEYFTLPYNEITTPVTSTVEELVLLLSTDYFNLTPYPIAGGSVIPQGLSLLTGGGMSQNFNTLKAGDHSLGINLLDFKVFLANGVYMQIEQDETGLDKDGTIGIHTGTDPAARFYGLVSELLKYDVGDASFNKYTLGYLNLENANGDFDALMGFSINGVGAQADQIKDGQMCGYIRRSGELKAVYRTYKNFNIVSETDITHYPDATSRMPIFFQVFGYLGIHPGILYYADTANMGLKIAHIEQYDSLKTSVQTPDLSLSILLENKGNTVDIAMVNGSWAQGNINNREQLRDPSARPATYSYDATSVSTPGTAEVSVLAFAVPEEVEMYTYFDEVGGVTATFRNGASNRVLDIRATCSNNKVVTLGLHVVPRSAVQFQVGADWRDLIPNYNVLQYAVNDDTDTDLVSPAFLPTDELISPLFIPFQNGESAVISFRNQDTRMAPGVATVVTVSAKDITVDDLVITFITDDKA